jgi:GT2 family glycosyltransferase
MSNDDCVPAGDRGSNGTVEKKFGSEVTRRQFGSPIAIRSGGQKSESMPSVSIIIVNFNGRVHLESCLPSVMAADYPKDKLEIIVVDNASSDDSVSWLRQAYPDVRLLANSSNLGFAQGINSGAEVAKGRYVALLNADMRVEKGWLSSLVETVRSGAGVVCSGSIVLNWLGDQIDYAGRPSDALNLCPEPPASAQGILKSANDCPLLFASGGAMLVARDVFLSLGGFDRDYFLYHEDVDLGWRLWLRGYRVLRSAASLVYHRGGASSKRLSPEFVQCLAQKYALCTVLKNVENERLWPVLARVLWFLVERSRWFVAARLSLGKAIRELTEEMDTVWRKREAIQSGRARSDAEIFGVCGDPFGFLRSNPNYQGYERYLSETGESVGPPAADATSVAQQIIKLLYHAYKFSFEESLNQSGSASGRETIDLGEKGLEDCVSVTRETPSKGPSKNSFLVPSMEQVARRVVPPAWRDYLRPVWDRVRNRLP